MRRHECFTRLAVHVIDLQGVRRASVQRREADDPAISEGKYEYRVALCIVEGEVEAAEDSGLRGYVGDSGYFEVPLQLRWTFGKKSESDALSLALVLNTFMGVRTTGTLTGCRACESLPSCGSLCRSLRHPLQMVQVLLLSYHRHLLTYHQDHGGRLV